MAGKHVVCEKPLSLTSKESGELVKLAAEKKLVNAVRKPAAPDDGEAS